MIHAEQTPINWTEIGVIIGGISIAFGVIGWFVVHKLSARREKEQRLERCNRAISDFEIAINKWEKSIRDTHVPRNQVWTVTLSGGLDLYVAALDEVRTKSSENIESYLRAIRPFMDAGSKARLDKAWQDYQAYNIEGRDEKDAETGQEFTSHTECKAALITCLEQMKKVAQEIEI
jgi:hypothetical protein